MNETFAIQALRFYYDATPTPLRIADFSSFLAQYRVKHPTFLDKFGATVRTMVQSKMKNAMETLGKKTTTLFLGTIDYFNILATVGVQVNASDIASAAVDGVIDAGKKLVDIGSSSLMIYVAIAAIGVFILPQLLKKSSAA